MYSNSSWIITVYVSMYIWNIADNIKKKKNFPFKWNSSICVKFHLAKQGASFYHNTTDSTLSHPWETQLTVWTKLNATHYCIRNIFEDDGMNLWSYLHPGEEFVRTQMCRKLKSLWSNCGIRLTSWMEDLPSYLKGGSA